MTERLHIFAVNATLDLCHTHHSRAQGGPPPDLPPLADWLGASVDSDEIELFARKDIGDLRLSEYVDMAFGVVGMGADDARRMDALGGAVLLVPDRALGGPPRPGAMLTLVASLDLAQADHRAALPKAALDAVAAQPSGVSTGGARRAGLAGWLLALALVALILLWGM